MIIDKNRIKLSINYETKGFIKYSHFCEMGNNVISNVMFNEIKFGNTNNF